MEELTLLIVVAILVEAVSDWVKDLVLSQVKWTKLVAFFVSISIVFTLQLDLFLLLGLKPAYPVVGGLLLSVFLSRGANFVHDLLDRVRSWKGNPTVPTYLEKKDEKGRV